MHVVQLVDETQDEQLVEQEVQVPLRSNIPSGQADRQEVLKRMPVVQLLQVVVVLLSLLKLV